MRALVTGGSGFVGRHMMRELLDRGWEVHGNDIADQPPFDIAEWMPGDCRALFRGATALGIYRWPFDLVVHCAAVVGGRAFIEGRPLELACEDLSIDAALFSWAMKAQPGRIVYYSSSAAYPIAYQDERHLEHAQMLVRMRERAAGTSSEDAVGGAYLHALSENLIQWGDDDEGWGDWRYESYGLPDQTYGWVKLTGERLAREYQAAGGKVTVLRPFSGYGSDQDPSYPFPAIMERVRRCEHPIDVWGPGTQVRDWIHIDDVIAGTLAAVEAEVDEPLNLCTGRATSFSDLVRLATRSEALARQRVNANWFLTATELVRPHPEQPTGVMYRVGDPTKMLTVYEPKVTLEEGIRRALHG